MSKCIGCGAKLQLDPKLEGYTTSLSNKLCERCFKIRNYNEYQVVIKDNNNYLDILSNINKTNDLVVLVVDLFNINKDLNTFSKFIDNDILLVLTKADLIPSNNEEKFKSFFDKYNLNIIDKIVISSYTNYNFDELYSMINKYRSSNKVYIVGYTNAGKSTMINKIIYNYSNNVEQITTSNLPSTTLNTIEINLGEYTIIDTPGLLDNNIINYIDSNTLKKIIPKKKIKPITYQVKGSQIFIIDNIMRLDCDDTNLTFFISNTLDIKRIYKDTNSLKEYKKYTFDVKDGEDIVIAGLGFVKISKSCKVDIYIVGETDVFVRESLIGG